MFGGFSQKELLKYHVPRAMFWSAVLALPLFFTHGFYAWLIGYMCVGAGYKWGFFNHGFMVEDKSRLTPYALDGACTCPPPDLEKHIAYCNGQCPVHGSPRQ